MIDFDLLVSSLPALAQGVLVTLQISLLGCVIGIVFGTLFGIITSSKMTMLRYVVNFFTAIIRGTPMLIQIFLVRYVLPYSGIVLSPFWSAVVAIGMNSSAYVCQIVRSGIASVDVGQVEASKTLGLSHVQIMRFIILPQAFQAVFPILGNELITLVKDSSLASTIGVTELTREASQIQSVSYDAVTTYVAVAAIYLFLTSVLSFIFYCIERRMSHHVEN